MRKKVEKRLKQISEKVAGYTGYMDYTGYMGYSGYMGYTSYMGYTGYMGYSGYMGYTSFRIFFGESATQVTLVTRV